MFSLDSNQAFVSMIRNLQRRSNVKLSASIALTIIKKLNIVLSNRPGQTSNFVANLKRATLAQYKSDLRSK